MRLDNVKLEPDLRLKIYEKVGSMPIDFPF